ncbi:MAG: tRNA (adenosine(37)-N6)-threonylcarbamoyltransferase complex ATPase subunit type 1 TsaE [Flavobacteriales bacterium]|nr:tRNA (adenosine(37)-N6)-threonylcarbamoyltransferase complex ATPase subunit type 1 TsaE [Flavobacteriales bacterium]
MTTTREFSIHSVQELGLVCEHLKTISEQQKIMLFSGEMGAGKTTLIKAFCAYIGISDEVSSPTFSLVNEYDSAVGPVYHFDLYRIRSEEELYDIGYEDYFFSGYLCLIEWPEMASDLIPTEHVMVNIRVKNDQRMITVNHSK